MWPMERRDYGQSDLFRARFDRIVDMGHPLAKLAATIDRAFSNSAWARFTPTLRARPPLPTRLMAGLAILKHMRDRSDGALCDRWIENPYFQLFCGEEFFQHKLCFDRSSLTRFRTISRLQSNC